jgi:hypothetical protein
MDPCLVIDRKRIFLFRLKTNIQQENATKYSADNKYSSQERKRCKMKEKLKTWFSGAKFASFRYLQMDNIYTQQQKHTAKNTLTVAFPWWVIGG